MFLCQGNTIAATSAVLVSGQSQLGQSIIGLTVSPDPEGSLVGGFT